MSGSQSSMGLDGHAGIAGASDFYGLQNSQNTNSTMTAASAHTGQVSGGRQPQEKFSR